MEREIRYCSTEDGVRIAYCVEGEGPPLLVLSVYFESFARDHYIPAYRDFMRALGAGRTLIRYDRRNVGLSQRGVINVGMEQNLIDLDAIVAHARLNQFDMWASTTSGPPAIAYCARSPERVRRLILYGAFSAVSEFIPLGAVEAMSHLARTNFPLAAQAIADMSGRREYPEIGARLTDWYLESITGEDAAQTLTKAASFDVRGLLGKVQAPTLILHRVQDPTIPFSCAEGLAAGIPNATLVPIEGRGHLFAVGDPEPIIRAAREFLGEPRPDDTSRKLVTVLFTDLVGHTSMMRQLGDERGRDLLREHERVTRDVLQQHGGVEVKTMGDGFMASFASVTRALDCAIDLQRAFASMRLPSPIDGQVLGVRCGLNAGEPIEEDGDLFGSSVIMASRIAAMAGAGEILIPEPLRHLLSGKSYVYADRGEVLLKGFDDAVGLYEVQWRE